jgi:hypothetical protein
LNINFYKRDQSGNESIFGSTAFISTDFLAHNEPTFQETSFVLDPSTLGVSDSVVIRIIVSAVDIDSSVLIQANNSNYASGLHIDFPFNNSIFKKQLEDTNQQSIINALIFG